MFLFVCGGVGMAIDELIVWRGDKQIRGREGVMLDCVITTVCRADTVHSAMTADVHGVNTCCCRK